MKLIAPRISDKAAKFLAENFRSLNAGAEYVLDSFPTLYTRTLYELKDNLAGGLTRQELSLIIDVFNAIALTNSLAGQHIIASVEDGCDLEDLDKKWDIQKTDLLKKLNLLPIFSLSCLEIWASGFWYGGRSGSEDRDLSTYIKTLL